MEQFKKEKNEKNKRGSVPKEKKKEDNRLGQVFSLGAAREIYRRGVVCWMIERQKGGQDERQAKDFVQYLSLTVNVFVFPPNCVQINLTHGSI